MGKSAFSLEERFWQKVDFSASGGCLEWTGYRSRDGYGVFRDGAALVLAHRFAYAISDPIPDGMCVLHHCDNPPCVNREHLWLGTPKDNAEDRERKHRGNQIGNPGPLHPLAVLSSAQVQDIRSRYAAGGVTQYALAAEYGVTQGHVSSITRGRRWATTNV